MFRPVVGGLRAGIRTLPGVFALALAFPGLASAQRQWSVPGELGTIQAAIDAAADGDEVVVADGTYAGAGNKDLDLGGKQITVRSENGPAACILDCEFSGRGFHFHSGETSASVVAGFSIRNGSVVGCGGGILCEGDSNPLLENCVVLGCTATLGGGMCSDASSPTVKDCTFRLNSCRQGGGGMMNQNGSHGKVVGCIFEANHAVGSNGGGVYNLVSSAPDLIDCQFLGNISDHVGGGVGNREDCHPTLHGCVFVGNYAAKYGGGMRSANTGTSPKLHSCTFWGNSAGEAGGGYAAGSDAVGKVGVSVLENCILWQDSAPLGAEIALIGTQPADVMVAHSDVQGGEVAVHQDPGFTLTWGEGNQDVDPLLVSPPDDLSLQAGSPCIDVGDGSELLGSKDLMGNPRLLDGDLDGVVAVDTGAFEFGNVHLDVTGQAVPGGLLTMDTRATPGLQSFLLVGTAPGEFLHPRYGTAFLDVTQPWWLLPWSPPPGGLPLVLPTNLSQRWLILQLLAVDFTGQAGNTSNALEIYFE